MVCFHKVTGSCETSPTPTYSAVTHNFQNSDHTSLIMAYSNYVQELQLHAISDKCSNTIHKMNLHFLLTFGLFKL